MYAGGSPVQLMKGLDSNKDQSQSFTSVQLAGDGVVCFSAHEICNSVSCIAGGSIQLLKGLDSSKVQSCFLAYFWGQRVSVATRRNTACSIPGLQSLAQQPCHNADRPMQLLKGLDSNKDQSYFLA